VDIPVFANGDVLTPLEAKQVLDETGAQGLMIGRGAQGNPWIFREIQAYLDSGVELPPPGNEEVHRVLCAHLRGLHQFYGPQQGVRVARKHIGWYLKDRPGGNALRARLMKVEEPEQQLGLIDAHFQTEERKAA
jgi:tRNA-dihydrouridine synthase B